jgi:hypothetical protein
MAMARIPWRWALATAASVLVCSIDAAPALAQNAPLLPPQQDTETAPMPRPMAATPSLPALDLPPAPRGCPAPEQVLQGPLASEGRSPPQLKPGPVQEGDVPLAINLPTALQLADARPLLIAAAQASLQLALAQWQHTRVLWIPHLNVGGSYLGHAGGSAGNLGPEFINGRDQLMIGGGVYAIYAITDAIFTPLYQRQILRAREADVQTARNDALLNVAEAYFNVQQERGRLAGMLDVQEKSQRLVGAIRKLSPELTSPIEVNRAQTQLADIEREAALRYQDWRVVSADLTRELRLNPITVVEPLEPPELQVTLISPREPVDALAVIGLTSRPELASHQALVQATLARLRQERMRPLIPSLILAGNPIPVAPYGNLMFGGPISAATTTLRRFASIPTSSSIGNWKTSASAMPPWSASARPTASAPWSNCSAFRTGWPPRSFRLMPAFNPPSSGSNERKPRSSKRRSLSPAISRPFARPPTSAAGSFLSIARWKRWIRCGRWNALTRTTLSASAITTRPSSNSTGRWAIRPAFWPASATTTATFARSMPRVRRRWPRSTLRRLANAAAPDTHARRGDLHRFDEAPSIKNHFGDRQCKLCASS